MCFGRSLCSARPIMLFVYSYCFYSVHVFFKTVTLLELTQVRLIHYYIALIHVLIYILTYLTYMQNHYATIPRIMRFKPPKTRPLSLSPSSQ